MQIPIRIKKETGQKNQLMPKPSNSIQNDSALLNYKRKARFKIWLLLILIIIEGGLLAFLFLTRPANPYQNLVPIQTVSTIYFYQSLLADLANSLKENQYGWPSLISFNQDLERFFNQADLKIGELQPLFEDQMALILLTKTDEISIRWLLIATKKVSEGQFGSSLDQIEKKLKQNFNLVAEVYRQTDITTIKPLNQGYQNFYFAHLKNLFLLSNDAQALKDTVDKVLK